MKLFETLMVLKLADDFIFGDEFKNRNIPDLNNVNS